MKTNTQAVAHAIDAVDMTSIGLSFINADIQPIVSALAVLSDFESKDVNAYYDRMCLVKGLAKLGCKLVDDALGCIEAERRSMQAKLYLVQGGSMMPSPVDIVKLMGKNPTPDQRRFLDEFKALDSETQRDLIRRVSVAAKERLNGMALLVRRAS